MNVRAVAEVLCHRLHPAEWDAPRPRDLPCPDCFGHAAALLEALPAPVLQIPSPTPGGRAPQTIGPIMHIEPPRPQVVPVAVPCPRCGFHPSRSYA